MEWAKGEDTSTEHYRRRAFDDFMKSNPILDAKILRRIYTLGENDPGSFNGRCNAGRCFEPDRLPAGPPRFGSQIGRKVFKENSL
jgi:hypothetical protein